MTSKEFKIWLDGFLTPLNLENTEVRPEYGAHYNHLTVLKTIHDKMKEVKATDKDMVKYHVSLRDGEFNAVFYKNKKIDKWWMEIPLVSKESSFQNHCFMPCSYSDYLIASKGEMPNRWWKAFQKMN